MEGSSAVSGGSIGSVLEDFGVFERRAKEGSLKRPFLDPAESGERVVLETADGESAVVLGA